MNLDNVPLANKEELRTLSEYAGEKKGNMEEQSGECEKMGFMSLMGDSKFADVDNAFCNFFCFTISDKDAIVEKIKIYENFYEEVRKLHPENSLEEVNCQDLRRKINMLKKKLSKEYETAKREVKETKSYAISNVHKSFIEEYDKLNWIVRDVENSALSDMLTAAQNGWQRALDEIQNLNEQLNEITGKLTDITGKHANINDKYNDLCKKYDDIKNKYDTVEAKQNILLHQNKKLQETVNEIKECIKKQNPPN